MSQTIRAKFRCETATGDQQVGQDIELTAVTDGSEENKSFAQYTPSGVLRMHVDNPETVGFFEQGKEYVIDISPAPTVG